ncbi:MAG: helix-turn-helix domain-containing protein [Firmicutes bacterium]|nr:helix-turn-helix domain-containing protein [Bacillota bacterium]
MKVFCERLNELRTDRDISMSELARQTGVPQQSISRWESGEGSPSVESVIKFAKHFNVSADFLLGLKDDYY